MKEIDESKAPLLDHLIELRGRLLKCVAAIGLCFVLCFYFAKEIFAVIVHPLVVAGQGKIIYTKLYEAFFTEVKVAFFAAMMLAFPILANQLWQFVAPGLYRNEKRAFLPFLLMTPLLFAAGAALAYFVAMPTAFHFLLSYQGDIGGIQQEALPGVADYLSFAMQFIFGFGLAFLLPVLLMLLERAGIVSRVQLKSGRRYAIVAAFVIAAVLTPPDVVSQVILAVPLMILYELSLVGIWLTERRRQREAVARDSAAAE
jgi:sec-independent protein translocase protein TatC